MKILPYQGSIARYGGVPGTITRIHSTGKNLWWQPEPRDTENEIMFSLRSDGEWRAFPGPADGVSLEVVSIYEDVDLQAYRALASVK